MRAGFPIIRSRCKVLIILCVVGRPMLHPLTQTMTTNEGDALDVVVEFCAEPSYSKVLWLSEDRVYVPGGELRDGVRALPIEVRLEV